MGNTILFIPRAELNAKANLNNFIEMCRDRLTVFGSDLKWDSNVWPKVGNFTVIGAPSRGFKESQLLNAEIMQFAKAYVRYQQGHRPTKLKNEFKAIRCIEKALLQVKGKADITLVDTQVMDIAGTVAREFKATAYQAGSSLSKLVSFLNESNIIPYPISWINPISKPTEIHRTDTVTQAKRAAKMPQEHCLDYMAEMFANNLLAQRDRFTTSIFALLMCAPSRITEVQDLPINCLHAEPDRKGIERLGLRFFAGKGYGSDIKWISTPFKEIAIEAVRRLKELSEEGHKLARWYEENPDKFYRHPECPDVGEFQPLTNIQACAALGLSTENSSAGGNLSNYFKKYAPYKELKLKKQPLTLAFLNTFCNSQLPAGWPWKNKERNIKYSDSLCCFRMHEFRDDFNTSPVLLWSPGKSTFTTDLNFINGQERSIWIRHGYKNPDGTEISMTSHQLRHFLNTAAQRGDMGQLDLAKWSGRTNVHQNATYNHMTTKEYVKLAEDAGVGNRGALAKIKANAPVTFSDLEALGDGIAHITEFGYCVHDFSMLPCQKHRDCLNCTEQVCVKGDEAKLERLKTQREGILLQLRKTEKAKSSGEYSESRLDRWTTHQLKTLERVDQLIQILESSEVEIGSVIRLRNEHEFSSLKRAIAANPINLAQTKLDSAEPTLDLVALRTLLGH